MNASELNGKKATVKFTTILHNKTSRNKQGELYIKIFSPQGNEVYSTVRKVDLSDQVPFFNIFEIDKAQLWSVDSPVLYTAEIAVASDENVYEK